MTNPHVSVLLQEIIESFAATPIRIFIDGTIGAGGHAAALLAAHPEIDHYIGIDQDPNALQIASIRLKKWQSKVIFKHANFSQFDVVLAELGFRRVDGILVDLGVSSMQLDQAERGFSFSKDGPLDMRMDPTNPVSAAEIINTRSEKELGKIFRELGEEKQWRVAAQAIVAARQKQPITTTLDLAKVLESVLYRNYKKGINPLTLIFQGLRIATNQELDKLELFMTKAFDYLAPAGRLAVISFHSLEDRIVKNQMRFQSDDKWETTGLGGIFRDKQPVTKTITKKPIGPTDDEMKINPRSRSAKLRVAEKI